MRILYFADIRFPLERANGIQTMETCHALAGRGHEVHLVVRPDTHTPARDPFSYYGLARSAGLIVEHAPVDALFADPRHPYTRALLASVLTPEPGLGIPDAGLGESAPDPANIPPGCRFHPRCPVAAAQCGTVDPAGIRAKGRLVECLLEAD